MNLLRRAFDSLNEALPLDVMPCSNGEYIPEEPTREHSAIMRLARENCDKAARRMGMSRRRFLRTGAATAICLMAIDTVMGGQAGGFTFGSSKKKSLCDLEF